jgi:hypothetical protein
MPTAKGWSRQFDEPIPLPDGGELRTPLDAGRYVDKLPRSMHEREEWQTVMEVLLSAVKGRESESLLRIALSRTLTLVLQESEVRCQAVEPRGSGMAAVTSNLISETRAQIITAI